MERKANLSLDLDTYEWLNGIKKRMQARSVPGVIRKIINLIRQSESSPEVAVEMIRMIEDISEEKHHQRIDDDFMPSYFEECESAQRYATQQGFNINNRF